MRQPTEKALESHARRAAKRAGYIAYKSRGQSGVDNHGGFRLLDAGGSCTIAGTWFELTAQDVIDYCAEASIT